MYAVLHEVCSRTDALVTPMKSLTAHVLLIYDVCRDYLASGINAFDVLTRKPVSPGDIADFRCTPYVRNTLLRPDIVLAWFYQNRTRTLPTVKFPPSILV